MTANEKEKSRNMSKSMTDKKRREATAEELCIVYQMAREDGLTKSEAHAAVHRHAETGCGYAWKHRDDEARCH